MNDNPLDTFLSESADDEGNAQCVYAVAGKRFLFCDAFGWMHYDDTHWNADSAEAALDRAIVATLKQRRRAAVDAEKEPIVKCSQPSARRVRDCKALFRSLVTATIEEFDASLDVLNVKNGVLNLRTGKLTPHDASQRFTYCIGVEYDPTADDSTWRAFLASATHGGDALIAYLQMAVGYSMTGRTTEECLWYIWGPSRSGKGTFTETILALLCRPLGVETDFATFTAQREGDTQNFDLAPLRPARFIVASESNRHSELNVAKLKALTGGNYIRAAFKHKSHFEYRPMFKVWLVSNEQINADVDDDAVWHRLKVIEFPNGHTGSEDKTLKQRMKSHDNLRGVLRWAVEGAIKWYASPTGLAHPEVVATSTRRHRQELDFVQGWLDECTERVDTSTREGWPADDTCWTSNDRTFKSYEHWCKENGVRPKSIRGLLRSLRVKGYEVDVQKKVGSKNYKGMANFLVDDLEVTEYGNRK